MLRSPQKLKIAGDPAQMKFVLSRYAPPATYSPFFFFACLYLSVKKNVGTKRRPQDVNDSEHLIEGKEKNRSVVRKERINKKKMRVSTSKQKYKSDLWRKTCTCQKFLVILQAKFDLSTK